MTINLSDNDPRISYSVAQGVVQSVFTVPFEFFDNDDLNVYVDGTLKTITTHYTVSGGSGSTGQVDISVTGASGGSTVIITRSIDLDRTTDFPSSGPFNIASLNTELDRMIAINADLKDQVDRSLQLSDFDTQVSTTLPLVDARKGTVLGFNATTGVPEAGPTIADVQTLAAITTDIGNLADIEDGTIATDAISGLAAIKANVTTVAGISSNVTSVAGNASNINTVAADGTDIGTVASSISNVNTVASISSNVTSVASIGSDITAVANDATDIGNVASSLSNINLVASNINSGVLTAVNDFGSVANATVTINDYGSV
tara:strand:+ start:69 stop:1019 length:951 start_codon:yes stop_codon:yes gene_type:complete